MFMLTHICPLFGCQESWGKGGCNLGYAYESITSLLVSKQVGNIFLGVFIFLICLVAKKVKGKLGERKSILCAQDLIFCLNPVSSSCRFMIRIHYDNFFPSF